MDKSHFYLIVLPVFVLCFTVFPCMVQAAWAESDWTDWTRARSLGAPDHLVIELWPGLEPQPGAEEIVTHRNEKYFDRHISKVQNPNITVYLPKKRKATGSAVVICPGGGYGILAYDHEGHDIARWFNSLGVAAFVLKYRLPSADQGENRHKVPLSDAQRAIRLVRDGAKEWNINPDRIGIMGFSAGGHLASTAGTHFDPGIRDEEDSLRAVSCRPDFMILMYGVLSMQHGVTHNGSKNNLLGDNPSPEMVTLFSNELQVTPKTPPTFLIHTEDDAVNVQNSLDFYLACKKSKVPAEMHLYAKGGHGYGLRNIGQPVMAWPKRCEEWLRSSKFIP
jgi:acetyl esterase/lipase